MAGDEEKAIQIAQQKLVYSKLPEEWKAEYPDTKFVEYQDWASRMRED